MVIVEGQQMGSFREDQIIRLSSNIYKIGLYNLSYSRMLEIEPTKWQDSGGRRFPSYGGSCLQSRAWYESV